MDRICSVTDEVLKELVDTAAKAGEDTGVCPVDAAFEIVKKAVEVSCGKGVMCRDGLNQVYLIVGDIINGKGREDDMDLLIETLEVIKECADCDLSYTTSVELLRLMKDFRGEWDLHIKRKSCKNLICPGCHTVHINAATCTGCGDCIKVCPVDAIKGGDGLFSVVDQAKCISCNKCIPVCPVDAIKGAGAVKPQGPTEPAAVGSWGNAAGGEGGRRRRRG